MRQYKPKACTVCGIIYTPTGQCSKYCSNCKIEQTKKVQKEAIKRWAFSKGYLNGKGSGSTTGSENKNHMYKHGQCTFRRWAKELKESDKGFCNFCNKDLRLLTHYEWVGHHKDHNRMNNTKENLILLCKKCHQIEHKCWNNFESVTTISKESRVDNNSKRLASEMSDDIVCSSQEYEANTRLIYGGSAYSYAHDPDFAEVGYNEKQWQEVINRFYNKYKRLAEWHKEILQEAIANKKLVMPTGRVFEFLPKDGKYPETTIKNYPVQGTGADIMSIIRVIFTKLFRQANIEGVIISTVHDSIVVDVVPGEEGKVVKLFEKAFELMPKNFEIIFGEEYNLPIFCEVSVGPNLKDLIEYVEF